MKKALKKEGNKLTGYVSGLRGNVSGLRGNVDECELTDGERAAGVDVSVLIRN